MTDPLKVRPCNCSGIWPYHIGIDTEGFSPISIRVWRSGCLMDRLQNRTFWHVKYQISTKLSPNLQTTVGELCMSMPSYLQGGQLKEGRVRTGNIKSISLMVACLSGSDAGQKCAKITRIFNFGIQLWLTRIRSDLVTADRPIILESTLNDSALYL